MNTDAVMCMALHEHQPLLNSALADDLLDLGVMLRKPIRAGMLKVRYSVCDFMMVVLPAVKKRHGDDLHFVHWTTPESDASLFS